MIKGLIILSVTCIVAVMCKLTEVPNPDATAKINNYVNEPNQGDGKYKYAFDTSNLIAVREEGTGGVEANGEFSWSSPQGIPFSISYVANSLGFQPKGDHLPTPPPNPPHIAELLKWLEEHPSDDDGSYKPDKTNE